MKVYNIIMTTISTLFKIMTNKRLNIINGVFSFDLFQNLKGSFRKTNLMILNGIKNCFLC